MAIDLKTENPSLNHLVIAREGKSGPDEYFKPGRVPGHVDPAVTETLAAFIAGMPS